jgi:hypothetical protein
MEKRTKRGKIFKIFDFNFKEVYNTIQPHRSNFRIWLSSAVSEVSANSTKIHGNTIARPQRGHPNAYKINNFNPTTHDSQWLDPKINL